MLVELAGVAQERLHWHRCRLHPELLDSLNGAIHLWFHDLADLDLDAVTAAATEAEIARAGRIINRQKRLLYLGGRIGLRKLLAGYTLTEPDALKLGYGHRGKPALLSPTRFGRLEFNYTLSGDKVLYALALDRQLGIDLECLPREISALSMAQRKLTKAERLAWQKLPPAARDSAMLCCWTRKEAYGKALGVGIRYCLNQVSVFERLSQPRFSVARQGLFEGTDSSAMPELLDGVQIGLPFEGVASLVFERRNAGDASPKITAFVLV